MNIIGHPADILLHKLWTKAVGTTDYDKEEWKEFQALLERMILAL